ncbi:MAG: DsbA family protein [Clostridiales bacterium]|nr:DsbA family protein [Clostridiales bacterium]
MEEIIITSYTDPVCVWCWATEPVLRALETRYPGMVTVRQVMGGLVRDMHDFEDADNHISGAQADLNTQVMSHWLQTAPRHRMPIQKAGFALFDEEHPSTYPQNIACKAAQLVSPKQADKFIRLLRLATFAQARQTASAAVQQELAVKAGINADAFTQALRDGSAEKAFKTDLGLVLATGVQAFPTFRVKSSRARQMMMRGYNTLADFERVFDALTDGTLRPLSSPPEEEVLRWLIDTRGPLCQEEVFQAFDFDSRMAADEWVSALVSKGDYQLQRIGDTYLIHLL